MALGITRVRESLRVPLLMLVILPFWTSFLIRVYAWIGILKGNGLINNLLLWLGLTDQPLQLLHTDLAVYIGIVYAYLPFMILPLYATLSRMDDSLLEAAADLGCRPLCAFWRVTVPLSLPGIIAGSLLVFVPAVGEFVIPDLLGGPDSLMIGRVLWTEFFSNRDWPVAAAVAVALLALLVVPVMLFERFRERGTAYERPPSDPGVQPARLRLCLSVRADRFADRATPSTNRAWSPCGVAFRPSGTAVCCTTSSCSAPPGSVFGSR